MEDFEQQLAEAATPIERMTLTAASVEDVTAPHFDRVASRIKKVLPLARKQVKRGEHRREYALLVRASGYMSYRQGAYKQAEKMFREALPFFERVSDRRNSAVTIQYLGCAAASLCEYEKAIGLFTDSLQKLEELEEYSHALRSMCNRAGVYQLTGRHHEALEHFSSTQRCAALHRDLSAESNAFVGLGMVYTSLGGFDTAIQFFLKSLSIREALHEDLGIADVLFNIGNVYAAIPESRMAITYYEKSLTIYERLERIESQALCFLSLGSMYLGIDGLAQAREWIEKGLELATLMDDPYPYASGLSILSDILLRSGEADAALTTIQTSLELLDRIGARNEIPFALLILGKAHAQKGNIPAAAASIDRAISMGMAEGLKPIIRDGYEVLSNIYREAGDPARALNYFQQYHTLNEELRRIEADRRMERIRMELEREQAEQREVLLRIEKERVERELDLKTKHLATMAMTIVQHSNFLNAVGKEIGATAKKVAKAHQRSLDQLAQRLKQQSESEHEWKQFEKQLESINPEVIASLARRFPELSPTELKVCALIKIGLASKEMASLLCVSLRSIESYRLQIRKKLDLQGEVNLGVFLLQS